MENNKSRKDAKIIVNIKSEDLASLEAAAKKENRKRNNFVITAALEKAKEVVAQV